MRNVSRFRLRAHTLAVELFIWRGGISTVISVPVLLFLLELRIIEQAAGHLRWKVDYPPSQLVGLGFKPHWRSQPAKLPSFGGI